MIERLDGWFAMNQAIDDLWQADWLLFRGDKVKGAAVLLRLMSSGWLPDYNTEMFPVIKMRRLFIKSGLGEKTFEKMLLENRQKVVSN